MAARTSVDAILTDFVASARGADLPGPELESVQRVVASLRDCLAANAHWVLTATEESLLATERELEPEGDAVSRVAEPDALLLVLPTFVLGDEWRPSDRSLRRIKHAVVGRLRDAAVAMLPGEDLLDLLVPIRDALGSEARSIRASR